MLFCSVSLSEHAACWQRRRNTNFYFSGRERQRVMVPRPEVSMSLAAAAPVDIGSSPTARSQRMVHQVPGASFSMR
ncbi:hypothetical protein AV530_014790 [Patagioenas fasciata monilis]|uniref:Uncharacterized protein n=1 Tax=Patagioenas fasciata monilis TaxID=372326 RepID=A0A1V4L0G0_PATFA|nr:hypothetical protein AV530_014790 [Patagioenas fasciata monilis]